MGMHGSKHSGQSGAVLRKLHPKCLGGLQDSLLHTDVTLEGLGAMLCQQDAGKGDQWFILVVAYPVTGRGRQGSL